MGHKEYKIKVKKLKEIVTKGKERWVDDEIQLAIKEIGQNPNELYAFYVFEEEKRKYARELWDKINEKWQDFSKKIDSAINPHDILEQEITIKYYMA